MQASFCPHSIAVFILRSAALDSLSPSLPSVHPPPLSKKIMINFALCPIFCIFASESGDDAHASLRNRNIKNLWLKPFIILFENLGLGMSKISIRFYKDHGVRAVWDEEHNQWWFSVLDIVGAINQQDDYEKNRNYWKYLKAKLRKENNEVVSATTQLKLTAPDGKKRLADVLCQGDVELLAKNIHNAKAMIFLDWFKYSENSIDGRSRKKAYTLIEGNIVADKDIGTVKALQQIHAYIFGGLYVFAGQIRTKTIWKDGTLFCRAEYLMKNLSLIEAMPETTFDEIVSKYVEMNVAHPFMEGNGRSTRIWLDLIFKKRLGLCVDWSKIDKKAYLEAMRRSTTDASHIKALLQGAMTDRIDDRETFMKGIDYSYYYEQEE